MTAPVAADASSRDGEPSSPPATPSQPASPADRRRRLEALLGVPATEGNEVRVLRNGDEIFPAMLEAIAGACRSVDLLTYVYWTGEPAEWFAEALSERASAGLPVRVLIDAVGGFPMDAALTRQMTDAGVQVEFFRRPWARSPFTHNHRTHRKVLVVDSETGFTGGVGIAEQWLGDARSPEEWRDTHLRIRGPAVAGLQAAFVQNWAETTGRPEGDGRWYPSLPQVGDQTVQVVRGTATLGWDDIETAWYALISGAERSLLLQTAYFAPDDFFVDLVLEVAGRGVDVQVLLPGPHYDKRVSRVASESFEQRLLAAGVGVWRYQPSMLHAKVLVVDGEVAMVGSSNFNRRSLDHDEEVAAIVIGGEVPGVLERQFRDDLTHSLPVRPEDVRARPPGRRLVQATLLPVRRFL